MKKAKLILMAVGCGVVVVFAWGCSGYDTKVSAEYSGADGWEAGASVDIEKLPMAAK